MEEIKNYRLREFLEQPAELQANYERILSKIQPLDVKRTLWDLKLKHIEELKQSGLEDGEVLLKIIGKMNRLKVSEVLEMRIITYFRALLSLKEQFEQILKAEKALIPKHTNLKWEMVDGPKRMAKYGIYNTVIPLSKQLNKSFKGVLNMSFSEVYTVLMYNKDNSDLQHEMNNIKLGQ